MSSCCCHVLLCVTVLLFRGLMVTRLCGSKCCGTTWATTTLIWQSWQLQLCRQNSWTSDSLRLLTAAQCWLLTA